MTGTRLPAGGRIDRTRPIGFTWEGRRLRGFAGDTLASALLANGVRVVGRSFKYHRPRGLYAAGAEEPNGIMDLSWGAGQHDPDARATTVELAEGMVARGVQGWPGTRHDLYAVFDLFHRFLPAGFYYKTFMKPSWHRYEPRIRALAGLGRVRELPDPRRFEARYAHCDILIVGAGPAGLAAARAAAAAGLSVWLVDDQPEPGGSLLWTQGIIDEQPAADWAGAAAASLAAQGNVRLLRRATAFGYYDHNALGVVERRVPSGPDWAEERLWIVRARRVVLATGAFERPLVFPDNDRPGIMSSAAVLRYLRQYSVLLGHSAVVVTNNDSAYDTAEALRGAGATVTLADIRASDPILAARTEASGIRYRPASVVLGTGGRSGVRWADLGPADATTRNAASERVPVDLIAVAGGWSPSVHLFSQARGKLRWDTENAGFYPTAAGTGQHLVGALAAPGDLAACLLGGHLAGIEAAAALGRAVSLAPPHAPPTPPATPPRAYWHVNLKNARQWLDFQNDVTVKDVALAAREGYVSVEHLKRYTTLGMATDQGKTSNINGLSALAGFTGRDIPAVGTTTFRPPYVPVSLGALAGTRHGRFYAPTRRLPAHDDHETAGAEFRDYGGWLRPACYPRPGETAHQAIQREAAAARAAAGLFDASSLGKIEVQGPDAAEFLNLIYYNELASLKPGRLRYALILRETGIIYDDGVIARLAPDRYLLSPSSSHTEGVLATLEQWHQTEWPHLRVAMHNATPAWATVAVCGPHAQQILQHLHTDIAFRDDALSHMAIAQGVIEGVPGRIARVSFTGERSYELSVPAAHGPALWRRLRDIGEPLGATPYGIETSSLLRAEKGYILIGVDTDGMTIPDDIGMAGPLRAKKVDFVGKRSLLTEDATRLDRRQFVGLLPDDPAQVPTVGSHVVEATNGARRSIGWITSAVHSPALGRSIALAMIERGRDRIGAAVSLFHFGQITSATIANPVFLDPEGARLHG